MSWQGWEGEAAVADSGTGGWTRRGTSITERQRGSSTRENGDLWEIAIWAISLPKVVNQVVNQGSKVVNCTCQSCESLFPPAKSCESMENSPRANGRRWQCFGRAQGKFTVHGQSSKSINSHQLTWDQFVTGLDWSSMVNILIQLNIYIKYVLQVTGQNRDQTQAL